MAFQPAPLTTNSRAGTGHEISWTVRPDAGKLRLIIGIKIKLLDQVKGAPKFWRLDIDRESWQGRLTGLIQTDGHSATRSGTVGNSSASQRFTWLADELLEFFPHDRQITQCQALKFVTVDSMGVVFELPAKRKDPLE